jgi:hypothetical protein
MLGYANTEQLLGKNMHQLIHYSYPDGNSMVVEDCRIYRAFRKGEGEHVDDEVLWMADGTSFLVEYWSYPQIVNDEVSGAVVTFTDINERKLAESYREMGNEILQILSKPGTMHDSIQNVLTALKTRTGFDAVGIRLRDGDDFPYVAQNGFSIDFLLTENTLIERGADGSFCRDKDGNISLQCTCGLVISGKTDTVVRVGGDEFLIIATQINSPENAAQIAEKLIHLVSRPVIFKEQQAVVGTSIGIALFLDHGQDMDQLIKQADEAMYRVKNAGKNGFRFVDTAIK